MKANWYVGQKFTRKLFSMYSDYTFLVLDLGLVLSLSIGLSSCVSTQDGNTMRRDLYKVNKRVLNLERKLEVNDQRQGEKINTASQSVANTKNKLEQVDMKFRTIEGQLDYLKEGVRLGYLPGDSQDEAKPTVDGRIKSIEQKLIVIGQTQDEILNLLKKNNAAVAPAEKADRKIKTLSALRSAFKNKHFQNVVDDALYIKSRMKTKYSQDEVHYYYANSLYNLGKLQEAALAFNELVESNHLKNKKSIVYLRLGDCFRHLGDPKAAKIYYDELVQKFPKSSEAKQAKKYILSLNDKVKK